MSKKEKMYAVAIAILSATVVGVCITGIMLKNENRVMHKIMELSCKTTYNYSQCMEGVELMLKNPDFMEKSFDQYVNRYKK